MGCDRIATDFERFPTVAEDLLSQLSLACGLMLHEEFPDTTAIFGSVGRERVLMATFPAGILTVRRIVTSAMSKKV
jgi:hypothetical protein